MQRMQFSVALLFARDTAVRDLEDDSSVLPNLSHYLRG